MMNMWSQAVKVDKDTFTVKVTNLFEGQNYLFRVAAENQSGRGAYAELPKPVTARLPFGKHITVYHSIVLCNTQRIRGFLTSALYKSTF